MAKPKKAPAKPRPKTKAKTKAKAKPKARAKSRATAGAKAGAKARPAAGVERVTLHSLKAPVGSHRARRRKGRGPGSGLGKTAGRGGKGQTARSGGSTRPGFEGGQMPLIRRIPKRGFTNPFKQIAQVVNVRQLGKLAEGVEVTPDTLFGAGLVGRPDQRIKLLGTGDVDRKFVVKSVAVSASARVKIEQAGGTIEA